MKKIKFSTIGITIEEKVNELRKRRNYEECYLDFYIDYDYFTYKESETE